MEKLRAKWAKEMVRLDIERHLSMETNAQLVACKQEGKMEAYEEVIRDSEWFNEAFSKLLAEVTEFHRHADEAYRMNRDLDQQPDADHYRDKAASYKHILDKLERLNQGKEVNT